MKHRYTPAPPAGADRTGADDLGRLCKALGHPARIRIIKHLLEENRCVCGRIVEVLPLAQSTVSQHLKILKEAGLILGEVEGPTDMLLCGQDKAGADRHFNIRFIALRVRRMKKTKELFPGERFQFQPEAEAKIAETIPAGPIGCGDDAPC